MKITVETISTEETADKALSCVVDGAHGIYTPKVFAQRYPWLCSGNLRVLNAGPDHEEYWDAWDDVTQSERIHLGESGDVFLVDNAEHRRERSELP